MHQEGVVVRPQEIAEEQATAEQHDRERAGRRTESLPNAGTANSPHPRNRSTADCAHIIAIVRRKSLPTSRI